MEFGGLVAEAFLAGAESTEVFDSLGDDIIEELEINAAALGWIGDMSALD